MIEKSWQDVIGDEFEKDYFKSLQDFVASRRAGGITVYPPEEKCYAAFAATPFDKVKVVILGQDPYINPDQAMGLSFSVPKGVKPPPSLKNIYKELAEDIEGFEIPSHGDLSSWAEQGVLLLNSVMSVEEGESGSHAKQGWETFTDAVIEKLNAEREGIVFMLWGNYSKKKGKKIDRDRHLVLEAGHPSPLSVRFFRDCKHFSKANAYLKGQGREPIDWQV